MGFGNPYGDPYDETEVLRTTEKLFALGSSVVSLADTTGISTPAMITSLYESVSSRFPEKEVGLHLHTKPQEAAEKVRAALDAGCQRLDGALGGFGGCPMADDDLTGNLPTERIIEILTSAHIPTGLDAAALARATGLVGEIFPIH